MAASVPVFAEEKRGDTLVVTPLENLREFEFDRLEAAAVGVFQEIEAKAVKNVVLDFGKTDFYGSTALGFFVKLWKRVRAGGGQLVFCNVSSHEREVLQLTHLDHCWPVCGSLEEALQVVHNH